MRKKATAILNKLNKLRLAQLRPLADIGVGFEWEIHVRANIGVLVRPRDVRSLNLSLVAAACPSIHPRTHSVRVLIYARLRFFDYTACACLAYFYSKDFS